jgi:hypothetical protein
METLRDFFNLWDNVHVTTYVTVRLKYYNPCHGNDIKGITAL